MGPPSRSGDVLVVTPRGVGDPGFVSLPHSRIGPLAATARISATPPSGNHSRPVTSMIACSAAESSAESPKPSRGSSRYSPVGEPQDHVLRPSAGREVPRRGPPQQSRWPQRAPPQSPDACDASWLGNGRLCGCESSRSWGRAFGSCRSCVSSRARRSPSARSPSTEPSTIRRSRRCSSVGQPQRTRS